MTSVQRKMFKELAESGRANTLAAHTQIAREALKAGGASQELIDALINKSLESRFIRKSGCFRPLSCLEARWVYPSISA